MLGNMNHNGALGGKETSNARLGFAYVLGRCTLQGTVCAVAWASVPSAWLVRMESRWTMDWCSDWLENGDLSAKEYVLEWWIGWQSGSGGCLGGMQHLARRLECLFGGCMSGLLESVMSLRRVGSLFRRACWEVWTWSMDS